MGQYIESVSRTKRLFGRMIGVFVTAAVSAALMACSAHSPLDPKTANQPDARIFEVKPTVLSKAVKRVLKKKKFSFDAARSTAQRIETEWLYEGDFRSRIEADIRSVSKHSSELAVQIFLEKKTLWQNTWQAVDKIGDTAYADLMHEIQMACYRVMYDAD